MMMVMMMKMMRFNRFHKKEIWVAGNLLYTATAETTDISWVKSARRCGVGGQVGGLLDLMVGRPVERRWRLW